MPAVCLLAPKVQGAHGETCTLSDVTGLPRRVFEFIRKRFPTYKLKYSKITRSEYYANTCPKCGVLFGDFYMHCEPGAPFFPTTEEEAGALCIQPIPLQGAIHVAASPAAGVGDLILENARRSTAEQTDALDEEKPSAFRRQ